MKITYGIFAALLFIGIGTLSWVPREIDVTPPVAINQTATIPTAVLPGIPEAKGGQSSSSLPQPSPLQKSNDLPYQPQLQNPPVVVQALYLTGWTAGSASRLPAIIALAKNKGANAVIVDIKDFSGHVSYATGIPEVKAAGAEAEIKIRNPNAVIAEFHKHNIYVIGRITVFQDPILAKAHPEWAMKNKTTGAVWKDNKGLAWMDPAAKGPWDYNIAIAKDALARGFDEVNFDYVRFASDGTLSNISFPFWDGKISRATVIKNFFKYLREELGEARLSADLFGLAAVNKDDLGIGQVIENAYLYFDYVCPMIYPSHYASGFLGYKNPAAYPYEVIKYSLERAQDRLHALARSTSTEVRPRAKLRPWIQVFDLGAKYDHQMIVKQTKAVEDVLKTSSSDAFAGWLYWDPKNTYLPL